MKKQRARRRQKQLSAWQQSERFREIGRQAITEWNLKRAERPRCRATSKGTGEQCGQSAMANGCCYYHGGRTPKGDGWHKPVWPNPDAPDAEQKLGRKLTNQKRAARKRAARVAAMTSEERIAHDRWQKAHRPGSAKKRSAHREFRRQNADAAKLLEAEHAPDPAVVDLQAEIDRLRALADKLKPFDIFG